MTHLKLERHTVNAPKCWSVWLTLFLCLFYYLKKKKKKFEFVQQLQLVVHLCPDELGSKYFCAGENEANRSVTLPSSLSSSASTPVLSVNSFTLTAGRGCVVVKSPWVPQLKDTTKDTPEVSFMTAWGRNVRTRGLHPQKSLNRCLFVREISPFSLFQLEHDIEINTKQ